MSHRFWAAIAIVMVCSLALGASLILRFHQDLEVSRGSLDRLAAFRLSLDVANRISAERGPSNRVVGEEPAPDGPSQQLLRHARAETDAALARASQTPGLAIAVPALTRSLTSARREIDRLGDLPLAAYGMTDVAAAAEGMFHAYDASRGLIDLSVSFLLGAETDLMGRAMVMRMLGDLRDFAGRLGSYLVIPMIHAQPLDPRGAAAFNRTEGRTRELWQLASNLTGASDDPAVLRAHEAVSARFWGDGIALLAQALDEARTGEFSTTATQFTAAIVPTFRPLEELRDAFIEATMNLLRERAAKARRSLILVAVVTAIALVLVLLLLIASQTMVFRPLLHARYRVVELADGKLDATAERSPPHGEMRDLYDALASLRAKLIERVALTEQLRHQADTDGLTGILNRRALQRLAENLTAEADGSRRISLIMIDLDHFKRINDNFGHVAGDEVLRETTRRLRGALRDEDVLARFGGEEFCVVSVTGVNHASECAERLRRALQDTPYLLETGQTLSVTGSFGTSVAVLRPGAWPRLLAAADAALYRAKLGGRNRVERQDIA